ncbi:MAG: ABC transporter ATP-binding protein [Acidobacteriota bacterium]|jgi:iron complex transport system ATP-binding protein|nr:ABC transporter ATP-binding protein [Acidobacteriota bacterium]
MNAATQGRNVLLEARNLRFDYHRPIVRDVSFSLEAGTMTGIVGPNGSGKTTILRLLDRILPPLSGEVHLSGRHALSTLTRREIAQRIAMVPQSGGVSDYQTVFQFAMQGRAPHLSRLGFESPDDERIVLEALEMTQMTRYLDARVSEISGGERQRLGLARALAQETPILLLDEFTANLDVNYQVELMRLVRDITRKKNLATLIVSHEINLLGAFCDRAILMAQGQVLHQGSVTEVLTRENLRKVFGLDFSIRHLPDDKVEVMPVLCPV